MAVLKLRFKLLFDGIEKKNKKKTIPITNRKIVERGKIDTPYAHIDDHSLSWLGTDTLIKSGGVELHM